LDFGLSEEQELLQRTAREFLAAECSPAVVRQTAQGDSGVSDALERKMVEMGWAGLLVPVAYGGLGLGVLDMAILLAELGRAGTPGPFLFSALLATATILYAGDRRHRRAWLERLASGECSATVAVLEESDRLDPGGVSTRARRAGAHYRLTGKKMFVPYAQRADLLITACRTSGDGGREGILLALVDPRAPGVRIRPLAMADRTRRLFEVELRSVEVPREDVFGGAGDGGKALARLLDLGALGLAADSFGIAERVLELSVDYSKIRHQFGRPIGSFQAVKHMAAEMVAEIEPSRSLLWYAAYAQDASPRDRSRAASMAKASLSEVAARAANRAVQIHGGIGFTWEHDLHFWFKRAKWNELAFGDPSFHRERVAELSDF
jgi:alkylation response protein AidB-like acyl-CoA dehydrogenase